MFEENKALLRKKQVVGTVRKKHPPYQILEAVTLTGLRGKQCSAEPLMQCLTISLFAALAHSIVVNLSVATGQLSVHH